ncbi:7-cyano-7-deazaguanine synthase QueC [Pseudobdellovibrio exovorus]|uniref:7-cyano-7-deazaguanine synthase n=1 Tax=Pseudobdellovibrio exovorus JSS TaxID=1184267 RepID=M4VR36_9BACT|nr:7-cyano-7-deazaguanine synthase QueC [Pseudobdellovibrio exovorus]AGH95634.1 succinoglycan biosynthesis regulator [Pseudobdellovibrio exovorus JSS]
MRKSSVVLLSAGLDSTVNFYAAMNETDVKLALTFDYGQKAAPKEIERSKMIANLLGVPHKIVELPWLKDLGASALTQDRMAIPAGKSALENPSMSVQTAKAVWVPNRNGVFLNIAASFAESLHAQLIVPGFNREEATTFPDNSLDFIRSARKAFSYSTANHVDVQCYTIAMAKNEIVDLGKKMRVPFESIWPCYQARDRWCGECESCERSKRAFKMAGLDFNYLYERY